MSANQTNLRDAIIIADEAGFTVYIDEPSLDVRYLLKDGYQTPQESLSPMAEASLMGSVPMPNVRSDYQMQLKRTIGHAMQLGLQGESDDAKKHLATVEKFLTDRAGEAARLWYVQAILVIMFGLYLIFPVLEYTLSGTIPESATASDLALAMAQDHFNTRKLYALAILGGTMGAGFSLLIRIGKISVDPAAGRMSHIGEVVYRLAIGSLAALIIVIGLEADAFAGFLDISSDDGLIRDELYYRTYWVVLIFSILAGASERLVPSLLQQLADNTSVNTGTTSDDLLDLQD